MLGPVRNGLQAFVTSGRWGFPARGAWLALGLWAAGAAAGCGDDSAANPCAGVDCSGHGTCRSDGFWPLCACDPGYEAVGATCLGGDGGDGGDAEDAGDVEAEGGAEDVGDDDAPDRGDAPLTCGDGRIDLGEECDDGNLETGDGCEADCRFSCHDGAECDDGEACTVDACTTIGSLRACTHTALATGTACDDGNDCTSPDVCNVAGACVGPAVVAGAPCDNGVFCDGSPDLCDGSGICLPLAFPPPCQVEGCVAGCDETTDVCLPAGTDVVCRPAAGPCDADDRCDGASTACPGDGFAAAGTPCDDGDDCTISDQCDGSGGCAGTFNC